MLITDPLVAFNCARNAVTMLYGPSRLTAIVASQSATPPPVPSENLPSRNILRHQVVGDSPPRRRAPAVDNVLCPSNIRRQAGRQENHQVGHFLGRPVAPDWDIRLIACPDAAGI